MTPRDFVHPLALAVLDDYNVHATRAWRIAKKPLLTPRAVAVLAAVERAQEMCENRKCSGDCAMCPYALIFDAMKVKP